MRLDCCNLHVSSTRNEEIIKHQIDEKQITKVFSSDIKLWKEYGCIMTKYNRMVLFKGNRWHSYALNSNIRYQKIIIKND